MYVRESMWCWMCVLVVKLRLFWNVSRSFITSTCLVLASSSRLRASSSCGFRSEQREKEKEKHLKDSTFTRDHDIPSINYVNEDNGVKVCVYRCWVRPLAFPLRPSAPHCGSSENQRSDRGSGCLYSKHKHTNIISQTQANTLFKNWLFK